MLDVWNTFNSVGWPVIDAAVRGINTPEYLVEMLLSWVTNRTLMTGKKMMLVGFADDFAIAGEVVTGQQLEDAIDPTLKDTDDSMRNRGLELSHQKSDSVILSRRRSFVPPRRSIGGHLIPLRNEIRLQQLRSLACGTVGGGTVGLETVGTKDNIQTIESNNTMTLPTSTTLSLETAIRLIPHFNGENVQEVYPFINACNFVMQNVDETLQPVLLQVIITKLSNKAFAITQHKEISTWEILRDNLEGTFCATRTPGYLQLELTTTKFQQGETVLDYRTKVEKLLHELCNVSTKDKSVSDAKAIYSYIKETTLTTYIEGLPSTIRSVVKPKNHPTLEEAIKDSLEEEKIYQSKKGTQHLETTMLILDNRINNPKNSIIKEIRRLNKYILQENWKRKGTGQKGRLSGSRVENSSPKLNILTCKIKLTNNYATYQIPQCVKGIANFLIDTGADLNIIKINALQDDVMVSDDKIYQMQEINDQLVNTLGRELTTKSNDTTIPARHEMIIPIQFDVQDSSEQPNVLIHSQKLEENQIIPIQKLSDLSHEIFDIVSMDNLQTNNTSVNTGNRIQLLKNTLKCDHMNTEEKKVTLDLCSKFSNIFYLEGDQMTYTNAVHHEIKTPGVTQPIHQKPYRLPYAQKEEIAKQVGEMQRDGIITPSDSPWNAPLLIVPKKSDDLGKKNRVVVDFRKLNSITVGDAFPMPNITEILDQLGKAKYFTCLDMASGYHQIKLHPDDREKTDDVIVIGTSLKDHLNQLERVFDRFQKYNLKLQPSKCEFLRKEVCYLGHIITDKGGKPDLKITDCVSNFPTSKTEKDVKSFLELKQLLSQQPILQYPDFSRPFIVTTDASNVAVGAILSQGKVGSDLPIAYVSRTLNKAEKNYNTTEKELLAIVWAVKQFRPYLFGRRFTVVTDYKPMTWLFNVKDPGARLVRWRLQLEEHDYEISYKPGRSNSNADALSRIAQVSSSAQLTHHT
ncbi:hypothetical protein QTP88_024117 [Uroleucon formosanum]